MKINTAQFVKGVVKDDPILHDGKPMVAFIGRSNVGKSSTINSLTNHKKLVKTSSTPGRTQQVNMFLINNAMYFADLPGYGFVKQSEALRDQLFELIDWFLFTGEYDHHKIVWVIDAKVGLTKDDQEILGAFHNYKKAVIVVANKVDKVKQPDYEKKLAAIQEQVGDYPVVPFSTPKRIGINQLNNLLAYHE